MSEKRVKFAGIADDDLEAAYNEVKAAGESGSSSKQTRFGFKEKHSLDSDEEDENADKYDLMHEDDIEGQEETKVDIEDGVTFTPFNMKDELEEGHFDSSGMYIFKKDKNAIQDNWMDNIDWVKVKSKVRTGDEDKDNDDDDDDDDESDDDEPEKIDEIPLYKEMVALMKPGESVLKALRRLGGGGKSGYSSASQRWKAKRQKVSDDSKKDPPVNMEDMLKLTELADKLLSVGNLEIYQNTYEKLTFKIKDAEAKVVASKPQILEGMDDDDAMDIFADDIDTKKVEKAADSLDMFSEKGKIESREDNRSDTAPGTSKPSKVETNGSGDLSSSKDILSTEVQWEYQWENNEDDKDTHGPYSSTQMLDWSEDGFFDDGVLVRKIGQSGQFYSSKRIDFDLYT